ncbi:hypothetical protein BV20DRAFT_980265, partial [Pilatotrama ljubarskyi]
MPSMGSQGASSRAGSSGADDGMPLPSVPAPTISATSRLPVQDRAAASNHPGNTPMAHTSTPGVDLQAALETVLSALRVPAPQYSDATSGRTSLMPGFTAPRMADLHELSGGFTLPSDAAGGHAMRVGPEATASLGCKTAASSSGLVSGLVGGQNHSDGVEQSTGSLSNLPEVVDEVIDPSLRTEPSTVTPQILSPFQASILEAREQSQS